MEVKENARIISHTAKAVGFLIRGDREGAGDNAPCSITHYLGAVMSELANLKMRVRALEILLEVRKIDRFDVPQRRDAARRKYLACSDLRLANNEEFLLEYEKYLRGKRG